MSLCERTMARGILQTWPDMAANIPTHGPRLCQPLAGSQLLSSCILMGTGRSGEGTVIWECALPSLWSPCSDRALLHPAPLLPFTNAVGHPRSCCQHPTSQVSLQEGYSRMPLSVHLHMTDGGGRFTSSGHWAPPAPPLAPSSPWGWMSSIGTQTYSNQTQLIGNHCHKR